MTPDQMKAIHKLSALSDEFLAEIGRVTAHFALLEKEMTLLVHRLLGLPAKIALSITSEMSFRGLQQLAAVLVKERLPSRMVACTDILKLVAAAEDKRNQITHSLWGFAGASQSGEYKVVRTKYTAKQRRGLHLAREEFTVMDLHNIAMQISVAAYEVDAFRCSLPSRRAILALPSPAEPQTPTAD